MYLNLLNENKGKCNSTTCPAALVHLDGSNFTGKTWLQSYGRKLQVDAGKPCLRLKRGNPLIVEEADCKDANHYICELDCSTGECNIIPSWAFTSIINADKCMPLPGALGVSQSCSPVFFHSTVGMNVLFF